MGMYSLIEDRENELLSEIVQAFEDIANPLAALQRTAEAEGCRLSGMAYTIANDPEFGRKIARRMIDKLGRSNG